MRKSIAEQLTVNRHKLKKVFTSNTGWLMSAVAAGASLCCAVTVLTIHAYNEQLPKLTGVVERPAAIAGLLPLPAATSLQANPPSQRIEAELITIRPTGFEPKEITRPAGRFLLAVDNRSGLEQVLLRLDREAGNRLREHLVPRKKLDWRELVDLTPGRYVLTEANNPGWVCRITITPN